MFPAIRTYGCTGSLLGFFFAETPQVQQVTARKLEEEQDWVLHEEQLQLRGFFPLHAAAPCRGRAQPLPAVQMRMTDHYGPLFRFLSGCRDCQEL